MNLSIILVGLLCSSTQAFFSINYQHNQNKHTEEKQQNVVVNNELVFKAPPTAEQVADVYARLAGKAPLLWEENVNLPALSFHAQHSMDSSKIPLLLEIHGGVLPKKTIPVIRSSAYQHSTEINGESIDSAPTLQEVQSILQAHGMEVQTKSMVGYGDNEIQELNHFLTSLEQNHQPVVILHHEFPTANHYILQRALSNSNSSSNTTVGLTEQEISQYQICLWVGLSFVLLLLASVCSIANMDVQPDSLLFAKFQSGRTGEKRE